MSEPDKTINKEQLMMQITKKMMIMTMIADINKNTLTDINITKIRTELQQYTHCLKKLIKLLLPYNASQEESGGHQ